MTKDQGTGMAERVAYGLIMAILTKLVGQGYLDTDMAAYLAAGIVSGGGALYAWWINRPKAILQSASALPEVKKIVSSDSAQVIDHSLPKVQAQ